MVHCVVSLSGSTVVLLLKELTNASDNKSIGIDYCQSEQVSVIQLVAIPILRYYEQLCKDQYRIIYSEQLEQSCLTVLTLCLDGE